MKTMYNFFIFTLFLVKICIVLLSKAYDNVVNQHVRLKLKVIVPVNQSVLKRLANIMGATLCHVDLWVYGRRLPKLLTKVTLVRYHSANHRRRLMRKLRP